MHGLKIFNICKVENKIFISQFFHEAGDRLLDYVLKVASGEVTKQEENGYRGIAIFKDGVTL